MNKKKILFLITKATWGGAQRYVYDLATRLEENEFAVEIAYGESGKLSKMLEEKNLKTHELSALRRDVAIFSDLRTFFRLWRLCKEVRPDIIHLNSSKAAALGALAAWISRVPRIVFTVHGWPFKENRNILARGIIYLISWFTASLSNATIVVSRHDEIIGKRMIIAGKKIHYVPLAIEPPNFLSREEASHSLSISTTVPRVLTIAELTPNKGLQYAIEAVALLKEREIKISYIVIGKGEGLEYLTRLAREKGVADRVHFVGFFENAARYLKATDIFLLPSIKEGMPYVLLEAAEAGLPIVTTDIVKASASNIARIHFVPRKNPHAIANELEKLIQNMPSLEPVGTGLFKEMLEKTVELYK